MNDRDFAGNRLVFDKEILSISSGDSITWLQVGKGHNIEQIKSPNAPGKTKIKLNSLLKSLT